MEFRRRDERSEPSRRRTAGDYSGAPRTDRRAPQYARVRGTGDPDVSVQSKSRVNNLVKFTKRETQADVDCENEKRTLNPST